MTGPSKAHHPHNASSPPRSQRDPRLSGLNRNPRSNQRRGGEGLQGFGRQVSPLKHARASRDEYGEGDPNPDEWGWEETSFNEWNSDCTTTKTDLEGAPLQNHQSSLAFVGTVEENSRETETTNLANTELAFVNPFAWLKERIKSLFSVDIDPENKQIVISGPFNFRLPIPVHTNVCWIVEQFQDLEDYIEALKSDVKEALKNGIFYFIEKSPLTEVIKESLKRGVEETIDEFVEFFVPNPFWNRIRNLIPDPSSLPCRESDSLPPPESPHVTLPPPPKSTPQNPPISNREPPLNNAPPQPNPGFNLPENRVTHSRPSPSSSSSTQVEARLTSPVEIKPPSLDQQLYATNLPRQGMLIAQWMIRIPGSFVSQTTTIRIETGEFLGDRTSANFKTMDEAQAYVHAQIAQNSWQGGAVIKGDDGAFYPYSIQLVRQTSGLSDSVELQVSRSTDDIPPFDRQNVENGNDSFMPAGGESVSQPVLVTSDGHTLDVSKITGDIATRAENDNGALRDRIGKRFDGLLEVIDRVDAQVHNDEFPLAKLDALVEGVRRQFKNNPSATEGLNSYLDLEADKEFLEIDLPNLTEVGITVATIIAAVVGAPVTATIFGIMGVILGVRNAAVQLDLAGDLARIAKIDRLGGDDFLSDSRGLQAEYLWAWANLIMAGVDGAIALGEGVNLVQKANRMVDSSGGRAFSRLTDEQMERLGNIAQLI